MRSGGAPLQACVSMLASEDAVSVRLDLYFSKRAGARQGREGRDSLRRRWLFRQVGHDREARDWRTWARDSKRSVPRPVCGGGRDCGVKALRQESQRAAGHGHERTPRPNTKAFLCLAHFGFKHWSFARRGPRLGWPRPARLAVRRTLFPGSRRRTRRGGCEGGAQTGFETRPRKKALSPTGEAARCSVPGPKSVAFRRRTVRHQLPQPQPMCGAPSRWPRYNDRRYLGQN